MDMSRCLDAGESLEEALIYLWFFSRDFLIVYSVFSAQGSSQSE
jgi:hypothetical protein